jgi:hypothetical protein
LQPPVLKLDIFSGLQLVSESVSGEQNDVVMMMDQQIGAGLLAGFLGPLSPVLKTLYLQSMWIAKADEEAIASSLQQLEDLILIFCVMDSHYVCLFVCLFTVCCYSCTIVWVHTDPCPQTNEHQ